MKELTAEVERQSRRPEVRAMVLKGAGRAFSAGHDLKEMMDRSLDGERDIFAVCNRLMATVQAVPGSVVAGPHRDATPAGQLLPAPSRLTNPNQYCRTRSFLGHYRSRSSNH